MINILNLMKVIFDIFIKYYKISESIITNQNLFFISKLCVLLFYLFNINF